MASEHKGFFPSELARLRSVAFQGETKKALIEMAPLRWNGSTAELRLVKRLTVVLSFEATEPGEHSQGGSQGRRPPRRSSRGQRGLLVRLATTEAGLYRVDYEDVFTDRGVVIPASALRLSRLGKTVPFRLEPNGDVLKSGASLYFVSEGAAANPYGKEAVFELSYRRSDVEARTMEVLTRPPAGVATEHYWKRLSHEENRSYQAALLEAPDLWLWEMLVAPVTKRFPFRVKGLAETTEPGHLSVWLQGTSDSPQSPDHHLRVFLNGHFLAESSWDGKRARRLTLPLPDGILQEGENQLELENVGDTDAAYSTVMLDRFEVHYPARLQAERGKLEGRFSQSGTASIANLSGVVRAVELSDPSKPRWIEGGGDSGASWSFRAESEEKYLVVSETATLRPRVRKARSSRLKEPS